MRRRVERVAGTLPLWLLSKYAAVLEPVLSLRFLKYCAVGLSGVGVNLGSLYVLNNIGVQTNLASILAIEISIITNFIANHFWTFKSRGAERSNTGVMVLRFHLASALGAAIQFLVFVSMNMIWFLTLYDRGARLAYYAGDTWLIRWFLKPLVAPPDVGVWVYSSQFIGIGVATLCNYLMNYYWTWSAHRR